MDAIDLMIVGAQKAGTTALKEYLNEHPHILGQSHVECSYFRNKEEYEQGYELAYKKYYGEEAKGRKVIAKSAGMYYEEESIQRLAETNPDCKLVFLVREPVERLFSAYQMEKFNGWLKHDFKDFKKVLRDRDYEHILYRVFIKLGLYAEHVKIMYRYFPKEQVKIVLYREFKESPQKVCQGIFEWLGIDNTFSPDLTKKYNVSKEARSSILTSLITTLKKDANPVKKIAKAVLPSKIFARLGHTVVELNKSSKKPEKPAQEIVESISDFYAPYNKEFEMLTGVDLGSWSKK